MNGYKTALDLSKDQKKKTTMTSRSENKDYILCFGFCIY